MRSGCGWPGKRRFYNRSKASARDAIARITDEWLGTEKIRRVEVYAEGDVRASGAAGSPFPNYRGEFRTTEVQLKCYDPGGPKTATNPPWDLAIMRRSGFLVARPSGARQIVVRGETLSAGAVGAGPGLSLVSASPVPAGAGTLVPTQAIATNSGATSGGGQNGPSGAGAVSSGGTGPTSVAPMVQRAGFASEPVSTAATTRETTSAVDPQVQLARAPQVPNAGTQPPDIDLPPIEGVPDVQVPKLPINREDLPPNIEPLPSPDGSFPVPELPRMGPVEGENNEPKIAPTPPPVVPIIGGFRTTSLFARSGANCRSFNCRRLLMVSGPTFAEAASTLSLARTSPARSTSRRTRP